MIRLISLLAISSLFIFGAGKACPSHYDPDRFEESSDELALYIDEYFIDRSISFPPTKHDLIRLGLIYDNMANEWLLPSSTVSYKELSFPVKSGIWKQKIFKESIIVTHLLTNEPIRISELDAINIYNGLLGAYWNDYRVDGYEMTLMPDDVKIRYKQRYFELNIYIYGLKNDATNLPKTYMDTVFRDVTQLVKKYMACKEEK